MVSLREYAVVVENIINGLNFLVAYYSGSYNLEKLIKFHPDPTPPTPRPQNSIILRSLTPSPFYLLLAAPSGGSEF